MTRPQQYPKLYRRWKAMRRRCNNPNAREYKHYGGRGIKVNPRWDDFCNFLEDMGPSYDPILELDRIDNNKGYSKENCRWATRSEQVNNTRRCHFLEIDGRRLNISQWSRATGVSRGLIKDRIRLGWAPKQAVFQPVLVQKKDSKGRFISYENHYGQL